MFSWGTREALLQVVSNQLGISPDILRIENQLEWVEDLSPIISKVQLDPIHMKSNQTLSCYSLETLNCMIHQESPARHIRSTIGASLLISLSLPHLCHKEWVPVLSLRQTSVTIYSFISQVTEKMFRKILTKKFEEIFQKILTFVEASSVTLCSFIPRWRRKCTLSTLEIRKSFWKQNTFSSSIIRFNSEGSMLLYLWILYFCICIFVYLKRWESTWTLLAREHVTPWQVIGTLRSKSTNVTPKQQVMLETSASVTTRPTNDNPLANIWSHLNVICYQGNNPHQ